MSPRARRLVPVILGALALVVVFAWSEGRLSKRTGPEDRPEAAVAPWTGDVLVVERRSVARVLDVSGTVRSRREATISSRVLGTVREVLVDEGARVKDGDVLIRLSAPELAARSASARGAVGAAEAALSQARRDLARTEALAAREAATLVELEQARTRVAVAEADVARAKDAAAAESEVASGTVLRAPFAGIVLDRRADPGDQAAPGVPLLLLGDDASPRLEAAVDERDAAGLTVGTIATVEIASLGLSVEGVIDEIVPAADEASRTQVVKLALPADPRLRSGLFGRMRLPAGGRDAVLVPEAAITRSGGLASVRVLDEAGVPRLRAVRLGAEAEPGLLEVLSGLDGGERLAPRDVR